jgi:hypothetical protein
MKYGLLGGLRRFMRNYGDYVQSVAIEYLYTLMGNSRKRSG